MECRLKEAVGSQEPKGVEGAGACAERLFSGVPDNVTAYAVGNFFAELELFDFNYSLIRICAASPATPQP